MKITKLTLTILLSFESEDLEGGGGGFWLAFMSPTPLLTGTQPGILAGCAGLSLKVNGI